MGKEPKIGLREAVAAVRAELAAAKADGANSEIGFDVGTVQIEFSVDVTAKGEGGAGVNIWVLSLSAGGGVERSSSHRITLTLNPVDAKGNSPRISDRVDVMPPPLPRPTISTRESWRDERSSASTRAASCGSLRRRRSVHPAPWANSLATS